MSENPIAPTPRSVHTIARPAVSPEIAAAAAGREFEAVFIGQMAKLMFESVESEGQFSGGGAESIFQGMLAEAVGDAVAAKGGFGVARLATQQVLELQEISK